MSLTAADLDLLVAATRSAPMGVAFASVEGLFLRANPAWYAMLGCEEDRLIGRPLAEVMGADRAAAAAQLVALLTTGVHVEPCEMRRGDGSPIEVDATCTLVRDAAGSPLYVVLYAQHATEPERATRALRRAEDSLEGGFAVAPVGMAILDTGFRFLRVNPAMARIFALPAEELVGRTYIEFLHPQERASAEAELGQLDRREVAGGEQERRICDAAGRIVYFRMAGSRITMLGQDCYSLVFVDVTAEREADAERTHLHAQVLHSERLRTLGTIAGGIAQEVNNPVAIAVGGVDLSRRHLATIADAARIGDLPVVRRHLHRLEESLRYCEDGTTRLAKVARKLSVFSALRGGDIEPVDVNVLVERACAMLRKDERDCAELTLELEAVPPLFAHPERLVLALNNLLVNAFQAIEGVAADNRITLSTKARSAEIEISVSDTGSGISQVTDRIFEPFYSTGVRAERSGLGLAVVLDVVRQHRGHIDVTSTPGVGSRFTVTLPIQNGLGPAPSVAAAPAPPAPRARILVVDDEPSLLAILAEHLSGHDVVTAPGGLEALALLAGDLKFDAILCDLMMRSVDGIAVHRYLLEHAPALAARTVFATGGAFTARASGYVARRGVPLLVKPFNGEQVRAAIAIFVPTGKK